MRGVSGLLGAMTGWFWRPAASRFLLALAFSLSPNFALSLLSANYHPPLPLAAGWLSGWLSGWLACVSFSLSLFPRLSKVTVQLNILKARLEIVVVAVIVAVLIATTV